MKQVVLPVIIEDMKEKFWARHCYLKVEQHNSNGEDSNNTAIENTNTAELLPGNQPVNPPATITHSPTAATAEQGMITRRMQMRIRDEAKRFGLVQTQSKTRKQKSGWEEPFSLNILVSHIN